MKRFEVWMRFYLLAWQMLPRPEGKDARLWKAQRRLTAARVADEEVAALRAALEERGFVADKKEG